MGVRFSRACLSKPDGRPPRARRASHALPAYGRSSLVRGGLLQTPQKKREGYSVENSAAIAVVVVAVVKCVLGRRNKSFGHSRNVPFLVVIKRRSRVLRRRTRQAALDKPRVHDWQLGFAILEQKASTTAANRAIEEKQPLVFLPKAAVMVV